MKIVAQEKARTGVPARFLCEALDEHDCVLFSATAVITATVEGKDLVLRPVGDGSLTAQSTRYVTVHKTRISCGKWEGIKSLDEPERLRPGDNLSWWPRIVTTSVDLLEV